MCLRVCRWQDTGCRLSFCLVEKIGQVTAMSSTRSTRILLVLVAQCFLLTNAAFAHPASGIAVDAQGRVYFIYTNHGVIRIGPSGKLTNIHAEAKGSHWLALDPGGAFSKVTPKQFERITPDGVITSLIFARGGAPLVVGPDNDLYYGSSGSQEDSFPPGAMTVERLSARGRRGLFAPSLKDKLTELKDGITGLASGPDGSIEARNLPPGCSVYGTIGLKIEDLAASWAPREISEGMMRGCSVLGNGHQAVTVSVLRLCLQRPKERSFVV